MGKPKTPKLKTFKVQMTTMAYMSGSLTVRATSLEEASTQALLRAGDVTWSYEGTCEGPGQGPEVRGAEEVK